METTLTKLIEKLYRRESAKRRGPCFIAVALELEKEIPSGRITPLQLVGIFGKPDFWCYHGGSGVFVYRFDHFRRGRNRDEWHYTFENHRVTSSGFNWRGVNDLAHLQTARDWPPTQWPAT